MDDEYSTLYVGSFVLLMLISGFIPQNVYVLLYWILLCWLGCLNKDVAGMFKEL